MREIFLRMRKLKQKFLLSVSSERTEWERERSGNSRRMQYLTHCEYFMKNILHKTRKIAIKIHSYLEMILRNDPGRI